MLSKMSASTGVETPGILSGNPPLKIRVEQEMIGWLTGDSGKQTESQERNGVWEEDVSSVLGI